MLPYMLVDIQSGEPIERRGRSGAMSGLSRACAEQRCDAKLCERIRCHGSGTITIVWHVMMVGDMLTMAV